VRIRNISRGLVEKTHALGFRNMTGEPGIGTLAPASEVQVA
jgi:hypothetical protein